MPNCFDVLSRTEEVKYLRLSLESQVMKSRNLKFIMKCFKHLNDLQTLLEPNLSLSKTQNFEKCTRWIYIVMWLFGRYWPTSIDCCHAILYFLTPTQNYLESLVWWKIHIIQYKERIPIRHEATKRKDKRKKKGHILKNNLDMRCMFIVFLLSPLEHKNKDNLVPIFIGGKTTKSVWGSRAIDAIDPLDPHECDDDKLIIIVCHAKAPKHLKKTTPHSDIMQFSCGASHLTQHMLTPCLDPHYLKCHQFHVRSWLFINYKRFFEAAMSPSHTTTFVHELSWGD